MTRVRRMALRIVAEIRLTLLAIWRGVVGLYNSNDLTFASSIAYYALLSLFPFLLLVFSILGSVTANSADRMAILDFILRYFPAVRLRHHQLDSLQQARIQLGVAGSFLMIWAAMGVFGAITSAVNHAWGVDKQPSYLKHKLISFVMLVAASLLLLVGLLLVSAINVAEARWFAVVAQGHRSWPCCITLRCAGPPRCVHRGRGAVFYCIPESPIPRRVGRRGRPGCLAWALLVSACPDLTASATSTARSPRWWSSSSGFISPPSCCCTAWK